MAENSVSIGRDYVDTSWKLLDATRERLLLARTRDDIVAIVRATARSILAADGVCFVLRDGEECHCLDEDAIAPLWKGERFRVDACISGWAMVEGRTAAIPDTTRDARVPQDAYRGTFVKSLIMAPVGSDAAIGAYWRAGLPPVAMEV
ncbi:MAG: GAF domain-containing protein [Rhizomicrobium sp.]